ncbi:type VI secretion system membrane subunit TssM [Collimonas silvisoli]|uniref:type VI secretion system membrane subunit TssM n=1 Tax=Collimonas silvisoli TaxID=2825884 RepID=UPI001B8BC7F7|nr:type VI secretion system membrane subunit TssM [Collimonas silvisoli]
MQKFFSFVFSRQMLAIVTVLVVGAALWFVGPLLAFGGLRPLESAGMRVTVIVLLLVLLLFVLLSWRISAVGVTALCLLIWHAGPLLTIGAAQPLAPVWVRVTAISVILLAYALYGLYLLWQALRENKDFLDPILRPGKDKLDPVAKEELKAVQGIVQRSLAQLKAMRTGAAGVRKLFEGKRYLYELPWYMVVGMPGAGKTTALVNSGLKFPLASQMGAASDTLALAGKGGTLHCDWWFTNEAVLIDTAGRYATHEMDGVKDKAEWHGFLGLLRKHRTRAPINGAIVTLNVAELLMQTEAVRLAHAAQLRERLVELRSELGIRFPVYVMVTKMDLLEGFTEYFQSLTTEGRAQVWGFTLPYGEDGQTSKNRKDEENPGATLESRLQAELQGLTQRLEDGLAVRLQEEFDNGLRRSLYALPQEFAGLAASLLQVVDAVFQDSRYDNTELGNTLRGVYFTSAAQADVNLPANPLTLLQRLRLAVTGKAGKTAKTISAVAVPAGMVESDKDNAPVPKAVAGSHRAALLETMPSGNRSYFLSDLFTKVIIPEAHLVRPNLRWEFRFQLLRLVGHVLVMVIFLWLASALIVSFSNNHDYLRTVAGKTAKLKQRVSNLFAASGSEKMLAVPDVLTAAQELPLFRGLDLADPSGAFGYGLYSAAPIADAAHSTYASLQDSLLLPQIIQRMEEVLAAAVRNQDTKTAYETLRVYLQLHDKAHYNADDLKAWVQKDWASSDSATIFGGRASMINHVNQLFSGKRVVQSPFLQNEALIQAARNFLDANPSTQRLYERSKAAMQIEAPQEFTLTRAVGPQAGTVFARASGQPLDRGIPGLFTYDGYHDLFSKRLPEFVLKAQIEDAWVMGQGQGQGQYSLLASAQKKTAYVASSALEDDVLTQDIRRQYLEEYTQQWTAFLEDIRTVTGTSLTFDLTVLRAFAAPDSPLSRLARAAARETTLSRPLVANSEDDKSILDKAAEKLNKKSRDVLGVSQQERQEKELVDNRFAALREVVTGQADAGLAQAATGAKPGLDNVSGLLNEYYTLLVVADTALNMNSLPPGSIEAGMKLKLEGDRLPAPFKAILTALADSGTQKISEGAATILRVQAQQQLDRINSMLAYQVSDVCKRGIEGRYPFAASGQDVSIDDFTRVFAAGGAADDFFQKQLAPFVDTSARPWKYKNPSAAAMAPADALATGVGISAGAPGTSLAVTANGPTLLGELLKLLAQQGPNPDAFARMQSIREAFFRDPGSKKMAWKVDMKVAEVDPSVTELIMDIDGQVQRYAHGPVQALAVNWPGPRGGTTAELTATPRIRPDTSSIVASGPWALFRLLERGKLIGSASNGRQAAEFNFDGRKVVLDLNTGSQPNPLTSDLFKGFSCPGSRS